MKRLTIIGLTVCILIISCGKEDITPNNFTDIYEEIYTDTTTYTPPNINYEFRMDGRTYQDNNGYYHLPLILDINQTLHRFGAYITNIDNLGLPSQVIWECNTFWYYEDDSGNDYPVPIVNGTSFADPILDSVFCMMAPVGEMQGDTVTIYGRAFFEEGDIILKDSINFIFE